MSLDKLRQKISNQSARLAVIGLGYVGLPLASEFARVGFQVWGVDAKNDRVDQVNRGIFPFSGNEPNLANQISEVVSRGRLKATTDYLILSDCDIILIAIETPIDEWNRPQYSALRHGLVNLSKVLQPGSLVIIESTIAPGTMQQLVLPVLNEGSGLIAGKDYYLGHCPERVMPGKLLSNLRSIDRVVGGMTAEVGEVMASLYRWIVQADLDITDWITAELVKTVENSYRDVQIAFANEVALVCEGVGGNVWRVRELVNKSPFRQMHLPGAGVGGHCIPKDPWLLADSASQSGAMLRLIPVARAINDSMPQHIAHLLVDAISEAGKRIQSSHILVLGYAYLEDSDDVRNSPSATLVQELEAAGAVITVHDSYVAEFQGDLMAMAGGCDALVVMVRHREYYNLDMPRLKGLLRPPPVLVDGRHVFDPVTLSAEGWIVRSLGIPATPG